MAARSCRGLLETMDGGKRVTDEALTKYFFVRLAHQERKANVFKLTTVHPEPIEGFLKTFARGSDFLIFSIAFVHFAQPLFP